MDYTTRVLRDLGAGIRYADATKIVNRPAGGDRWTAYVHVLGHDAIGVGRTKRAALEHAISDLPEHVQRHLAPPTWIVVVNSVGGVLGVYGSALRDAADNLATSIAAVQGLRTRVVEVQGDRPHVGDTIGGVS